MRQFLVAWIILAMGGMAGAAESSVASPTILIRAEMLTVTPATGPVTHVLVKNAGTTAFEGQITVQFPEGWKVNRPQQPLKIASGQTARVAFAIEKATNRADNSYPLRIDITNAAGPVASVTQSVVCASAPYLDAAADGKIDEWKDAIPATFVTRGKKTIIRTGWTRRTLSMLIALEEDAQREGDAVQVAIAPQDAMTPTKAGEKSQRWEYLLMHTTAGDQCLMLLKPGEALTKDPVALAGRQTPGAKVAIFRQDGWTYYECTIPMKPMAALQAEPGREFRMSVLVHDEGTGLRDWGAAAGLWAEQRTVLGWCNWAGARWPAEAPFDSAVEWGFCSSAQ